ncbi:hypothetical protein C4J89_1073 [Pseudomonas sp. R4-35-07]|nr:hypothetical protein C4J91_1144 [Pseudomonas sp. R3-52-08]AZF30564.1 hypothetical protein C4J89_1073 [Pseudomonas sp. R4-35-07]
MRDLNMFFLGRILECLGAFGTSLVSRASARQSIAHQRKNQP